MAVCKDRRHLTQAQPARFKQNCEVVDEIRGLIEQSLIAFSGSSQSDFHPFFADFLSAFQHAARDQLGRVTLRGISLRAILDYGLQRPEKPRFRSRRFAKTAFCAQVTCGTCRARPHQQRITITVTD